MVVTPLISITTHTTLVRTVFTLLRALTWTTFFPLNSISRFVFITFRIVRDFKLSPHRECCILSFRWLPGLWILCTDVSEHCSIFLASEFYMRTFRKSVPSSRRLKFCVQTLRNTVTSSGSLNFVCRRFGTLFHLPGVWIFYADVSEIRSIFSASEFFVQTLRNTVPSSGSLNFVCRRFRTLSLFHLHRSFKEEERTYEEGTYRVFWNVCK